MCTESEGAADCASSLQQQLDDALRTVAKLGQELERAQHGDAARGEAASPLAALARSEVFLRQVIDTNPDAIFVRDAQSRYVLLNRALCEFYGLPAEQIVGATPSELAQRLGLDLAQARDAERHDAIARERGLRQEWVDGSTDRRGSNRWFRTILVPMSDAGQADYVLGVCSDITQQRVIEHALRQSERNYRYLVENAPVGILAVDAEGNLIEANAALLEMPGFSDLIGTLDSTGRGVNVLIEPSMVAIGVAEDAGHCLDSGEAREVERRYMVEGREVVLRYRMQPIRDEDDELTGALGLIEDISDRVRLERQLHQASKMEAIGRLAGGIAHDFNNLLTVINGYSEVRLAKLAPGDALYEDLTQIRHAGDRAADLTRRLLAFSRHEDVVIEQLDLNELLRAMAKLLQRILGEEITLTLALAETLPPIEADAGQIEQIIINLAVNARDAILDTLAVGERPGIIPGTPNGELTISTALKTLDADEMPTYLDAAPGPYVAVTVRDTGTGMSREILDHLFEPFFTTKEVGKGTGLGLAIVYAALQDLGGTVDVQSQVGEGTAFCLYFPLTAHLQTSRQGDDQLLATPRGGERILVVEDQDYVRELTARMLGDLGYTVHVAASGLEALAMCAAGLQVDLVVSDVVMPGMSGPALAAALRTELPDVPVLYVSGYAKDALAERAGLATPTRLISKPFTVERLGWAVREALSERRQEDARR